jgi:(R,R)-butanediol dehydrogenase/meso-butanediol dehydrogenase/diacetyl reductase
MIDGNFVVVAIHERPIEIAPLDLLMPEVRITGVALSCNDFPAVIDAMAGGTFPTDGWVSTIPLERIIDDGFERLHRQEALKLLVDVETARPGC